MRITRQQFLSVVILIAFAFATTDAAKAVNLYAASGQGASGELYILDPATGATVTDVGPLNDSTARNFGMTGLAFDPVSGVLYGSSANANADPSTRGQLVTINPANGLVTPIGSFALAAGGTMTDLAFDPNTHVLYGLPSNGGASLFTINTSTGQSTLVGSSGFTATNGGGLAVSSASVIYATPLPANFGTYDATTGAYTNIGTPTLPNGRGYGALSFNGSVLYGVEAGTASHLVKIDTTSGAVTDLGATAAQFLDGLAFSPAATVLAGDYNNNGKVDAADYPLWRKNNGTSNSLGPNDPLGPPITLAQYTQWRTNFGKPATGSGVNVSSVPEPSTILLLMVSLVGVLGRRRSAL
jgi:PEP-CTERM motif